jgi:hypothetical protein
MSGYTAKAWQTVASGGLWTMGEIRKACSQYDGHLIDNAVRSMVSSGMLVRHEGDSPRYGVTKDCSVPRGLTLGELMKVLGV